MKRNTWAHFIVVVVKFRQKRKYILNIKSDWLSCNCKKFTLEFSPYDFFI